MVNTKKQAQVKTEYIAAKNPKNGKETKRKPLNKVYQETMKEFKNCEKDRKNISSLSQLVVSRYSL